jgi:hypothetical protein
METSKCKLYSYDINVTWKDVSLPYAKVKRPSYATVKKHDSRNMRLNRNVVLNHQIDTESNKEILDATPFPDTSYTCRMHVGIGFHRRMPHCHTCRTDCSIRQRYIQGNETHH